MFIHTHRPTMVFLHYLAHFPSDIRQRNTFPVSTTLVDIKCEKNTAHRSLNYFHGKWIVMQTEMVTPKFDSYNINAYQIDMIFRYDVIFYPDNAIV